MPEVPHTNTEHNHDLVCEQNECKQGINPGKNTRGARQPKIFCQPVVPDAYVTRRMTSPWNLLYGKSSHFATLFNTDASWLDPVLKLHLR